jgi:hypothetical protein
VTDFEGFKKSMVYPPVLMGLPLDKEDSLRHPPCRDGMPWNSYS